MSTQNINLEKIILADTINGSMLEKINNNMQKIDEKYGELKNSLLEQTGKTTLAEAIVHVQTLANQLAFFNSNGDATVSDILSGKLAVVNGEIVIGAIPLLGEQTIVPTTTNRTIASGQYLSGVQTIQGDANLIPENIVSGKSIFGVNGNARKIQNIEVTLSGSYASQISGYGAGIDQKGTLVIWAMSNTTNYEHINFVAHSVVGTKQSGWDVTDFDTADPIGVPHACTIADLSEYSSISVVLNASSRSSAYDYTTIQVTITGS